MLELWAAAAILLFVPYEHLWWALLLLAVVSAPGLRARWGAAPFIPTGNAVCAIMLRHAAIKPGERVYDLGCGDGRLVRLAAKAGGNAMGIEASPLTCVLAWLRCLGTRNARIRFGDLWKGEYRDADVVFCYLLVAGMQRFEREIWPTLRPGTRVVSNNFRMKGVEAEAVEGGVYLYRKSH